METRTVSPMKALELQAALNIAKSGRLKIDPAYHKIEVHGDLMLVDPLNDAPFVFVAPDTVHVFQYKPGDGTDHLRQRTKAELWFQNLSQAFDTQASKKPQGGSRLGM